MIRELTYLSYIQIDAFEILRKPAESVSKMPVNKHIYFRKCVIKQPKMKTKRLADRLAT